MYLINDVCMHVIKVKYAFFLKFSFVCFFVFQVVVPSLHLGLGIYKNLFDKLEAECHEIDSIIYKAMVVDGSDENDSPEPT